MKRREFIKGVVPAAAGLAAASSLAAPAIAQNKRELKMVTSWPKNFPGMGTGAERLAKRISEATDGQITVRVFSAGELVPAFEVFDAVSSGTAEMYHSAEYYWPGKSPAFNFFSAVPFGLTAAENNAWIYHGGGQQVWDELSAKFNVKAMLVGNTGVQMGGWFNKEINTLDDLKGLKMRIPGLGGEVLRRLGASTLSLPGGEIYPALQSGAIDATEWVGPWNDLAFGFYKVAKFYYYPGFHEPGTSFSVGFNLGVWDGFTPAQKQIMQACAGAENDYMLAEFNARNGDALNTLVTKHNVQLKRFSDDVMKEVGRVSGETIAELAAGNADVKKVYDSFIDFRTNAKEWANLAENAYYHVRNLDYPYTK
ncbi:TRAP transporter substrate-binding protein [Caenispirillum bisanense]|uniref:TRAP transporter substrate-binding protein n=1 Tax=Caenispirillum bisanense TaxID=414052 RepID=UPI0031D4555D